MLCVMAAGFRSNPMRYVELRDDLVFLISSDLHCRGASLALQCWRICCILLESTWDPKISLAPPLPIIPTAIGSTRNLFASTKRSCAISEGAGIYRRRSPAWNSGMKNWRRFRKRLPRWSPSSARLRSGAGKIPRNCLTLPFWRRIVPDLRVVLLLRYPLEVAASLHTRNGISPTFSYHLWRIYNERILATADHGTLLVTHYNSFFSEPNAQLSRVLHHVGLSAAKLPAVEAMVTKTHRHHYATLKQVIEARIPDTVARLYAELVERTSESDTDVIPVRPLGEWRAPTLPTAEQPPTRETVAELRSLVAERTAWAQNADQALEQATAIIAQL